MSTSLYSTVRLFCTATSRSFAVTHRPQSFFVNKVSCAVYIRSIDVPRMLMTLFEVWILVLSWMVLLMKHTLRKNNLIAVDRSTLTSINLSETFKGILIKRAILLQHHRETDAKTNKDAWTERLCIELRLDQDVAKYWDHSSLRELINSSSQQNCSKQNLQLLQQHLYAQH